jgi:hypothetical protein
MPPTVIRIRARRLAATLVAAGSLAFTLAIGVNASGATVTRGAVHAFATGAGLEIAGHAQMVRTADGRTIVTVHVDGLDPDTTYPAHVHQGACAVGDADGHFRFDPAGPAAPPNEIWVGFTTNSAGIGSGLAIVNGTAGSGAVSVVIHAPSGAKIACADLS